MALALQDGLVQAFIAEYGREPEVITRAPGRVNLIGEHTDYNDGFVLPIAIDRAVYIAAASRSDDSVRLQALDFNDRASFNLAAIHFDKQHLWSNYPRGVAWVLQRRGFALSGMDAIISGDVPIGAGLSSSAAIEVAVTKTFQALAGLAIPATELALAAQEAENRFVGMNCGIMDQFISVLGQRGHALLIDCRSLEHEPVPIPAGCSVIVANTMKQRGLVDSEYNRRRAECEEGVRLLKHVLPNIRALRDVSPLDLERFGHLLPETVLRRCRHVVGENARVLEAVAALRQGNGGRFGELMLASHASLRDDYEVSCAELDLMVEAALDEPGVNGARMTGAGFGGCTVTLVQADYTERVATAVREKYTAWCGIVPEVYVFQAEAGAETTKLHP
ncbi:MAG: galactokinase [Anaerolineae bacterium]